MGQKIAFALALLLVSGASAAQDANTLDTFWVPRSNNVIVAEIKSPNTGVTHYVESRDGTRVTFRKKGDPFAIAFLTAMIDGQARFSPYRITFNADGAENAAQVRLVDEDRRTIPFGKTCQFRFNQMPEPFKIRAIETFEGYFPGRPPIEFIPDANGQIPSDLLKKMQSGSGFGESDGAICCIECEGEIACTSGSLRNACGSCSAGVWRI